MKLEKYIKPQVGVEPNVQGALPAALVGAMEAAGLAVGAAAGFAAGHKLFGNIVPNRPKLVLQE